MSQEREEVRDNLKALSAYLFESSGPDFMYQSVEKAIELLAGWEPIETAPKDTWVLVVDADRQELAVWRSKKITERDGHPVYSDDVSGVSGYEWEVDITPTHWRPLPDPPTT